MGWESFERIARQVFPLLRSWEPTVSGEPMLAKDFDKMLALAEQFGVMTEIYTNGTLLSDRMIDRLLPTLSIALISVDGAQRETFEAIREGAEFEKTLANVAALRRACDELPAGRRPELGFSVTLMADNTDELPALVELAAELRLQFVRVTRMMVVDPGLRDRALEQDMARTHQSLDRAFELARELGIHLVAYPVEEPDHHPIPPPREVNAHLRTARQAFDRSHRDHARIADRRADAARSMSFPAPRPANPEPPERDPIWYCDFLWNRTYIHLGGNVQPCCVNPMPDVGNVEQQPFDQLWNNDNYRALRQRLVMRDPAPACRGCWHIQELRDPARIDAALQGMEIPRPDEVGALPAALDPAQQRPRRSTPPPVLTWDADPDAQSYTVEFSLDGFHSVLFTSEDYPPRIVENRYEVPAWAWVHAPVSEAIQWRALARLADGRRPVGGGVIPPETPVPAEEPG